MAQDIHQTKSKKVNQWLIRHGVGRLMDWVYDGQGVITDIQKDHIKGYFIEITPKLSNHDLGNGEGEKIRIEF